MNLNMDALDSFHYTAFSWDYIQVFLFSLPSNILLKVKTFTDYLLEQRLGVANIDSLQSSADSNSVERGSVVLLDPFLERSGEHCYVSLSLSCNAHHFNLF